VALLDLYIFIFGDVSFVYIYVWSCGRLVEVKFLNECVYVCSFSVFMCFILFCVFVVVVTPRLLVRSF